jgi:microcystin-dependent protein
MKDYGGGTIPDSFLVCDGGDGSGAGTGSLNATALPKFKKLWDTIGTTYGGTGITDFKVPNCRGRTTVGDGAPGSNNDSTFGPSPGTTPLTRGKTVGEQTHALTAGESGVRDHGHSISQASDGSHVHTVSGKVTGATSDGSYGHGDNGFRVTATGDVPTGPSANMPAGLAEGGHDHLLTVGSVNGGLSGASGSAHFNMQPSLVVTKMIRY